MTQPLVLQVFIFKQGQFLGNEMATGMRIEIGRDPDCGIVLESEACSRKHAILFAHEDMIGLQDLGSANGTLVNGERISGVRVVGARDDIVIGEFSLKLKSMGPARDVPVSPMEASQSTQLIEPLSPDLAAGFGVSPASAATTVAPRPGTGPIVTEVQKAPGGSQPDSLEEILFGSIEGADGEWDADRTVNLEAGEYEPPTAIMKPQAKVDSDAPRGVTMGPMAALSENPTVVVETPVAAAAGPAPGLQEHSQPSEPPMPAVTMPEGLTEEAPTPPLLPDSAIGPAVAAPSWVPGAVLDDDDDDDDPEEDIGWSIVQRLVREPSPDASDVETCSLEVLHYRGEKLLDHVALQPGEAYKFGRKLAKDALVARGLKRPHKLVTHKKRGISELRLHEAIDGKVLRQGQQVPMASLAEKNKAPFSFGEMATLHVGGDTVYLRYSNEPSVVAGEVYQTQRKEDLKMAGIALGASVGMVVLLLVVGWVLQFRAHAGEIIQLEDEGFAEVFEQVDPLELEKPEPEPEEEVIPETPPDPETPQPKTPEPEVKKPSALSALENIPKVNDKASHQNMKAALSNIKAVASPSQAGLKLSALTGKGPTSGVQIGGAAGGEATRGLNSILRKGAVGTLGKKKRGKVKGRVRTLRPRLKNDGGQLSRDEIQRVINRNITQIQYCYEKQLRTAPNLHGKVVLEWFIKNTGRVGVVKNKGSTLPSSPAITCMINKIKRWKFPKPRGNGGVIVKYPFIFNTI